MSTFSIIFMLFSFGVLIGFTTLCLINFRVANKSIAFTIKENNYDILSLGEITKFAVEMEGSIANIKDIEKSSISENDKIYLAISVCGIKVEEAIIAIKSAVLFSNDFTLHFIILAESYHENITNLLNDLQDRRTFYFTLIKPNLTNTEERLYKYCLSTKLFLPSLLPNIDSVIYIESNSVFLGPPSLLWFQLSMFVDTEILGICLDDKYSDREPVLKSLTKYDAGVNTGVILMNLTRMREFNWTQNVHALYHKIKAKYLKSPETVLINYLYFKNPNKIRLLSCLFNFRKTHCTVLDKCDVNQNQEPKIMGVQENQGIIILRLYPEKYFIDIQPAFGTIYMMIHDYQLDQEPNRTALEILERFRHESPCAVEYYLNTAKIKIIHK